MRRNLLLAYQADRQYLNFRWLILLFAGLMSYEPHRAVLLGAVLGLESLIGFAAHFSVKSLDQYKSKGHMYPSLLRLLDLASICLASSR